VVGNDDELLRRLRRHDAEAFATLIERHHGGLLRLAQAFVPSRAIAEEVVQETWLAVLQGLDRFEGRASLQSWIFRILANRAKTRGVREHRTIPFSSLAQETESDEHAVDPERFRSDGMWGTPPRRWEDGAADDVLMTRQGLDRLLAAIEELPPGQRAVVTLRDIDGLNAEDACNILEITETNQRVLLHRARSKLRAVLEACVDRK
jgi:RNA polymerase sigma-70 factor (ECF subfamily)